MQDFHDLVQLCQGKTIYIQTHNFPDPDAIGSAFGLQRLLAHFGVEAALCYAGRIDRLSASKMLDLFGIRTLSQEQLRGQMQEKDAIICVDSQKGGGNITDFVGNEIACIDHHPTFQQVDYQYAELQITGACATLIARYYQELGIEPDVDTATALLYGLRMDTLKFSRGVSPWDIEMFGYLFSRADQEKLSELERNNMELQDLRAYGAAIDSIRIYDKTGFAFIPFNCPDGLIAALADFILSLEEVTVSVVGCQRPEGMKLSVRSERPDVHAGYLIREALDGLGDGGGHREMAGGMIRKEQMEQLGAGAETMIAERFLGNKRRK